MSSRPSELSSHLHNNPVLELSCCAKPPLGEGRFSSLPLRQRRKRTMDFADINLPRPADSFLRIVMHFDPMGDPAGKPADRKQHREHANRNAECPIDDARIEI